MSSINYERLDNLLSLIDDKEASSSIIKDFLNSSPGKISEILQLIETREYGLISKNAHRMIANAGNLGAMQLSDLCSKIETAAIEKNENKLQSLSKSLLDESKEVYRILNEKLQSLT